MVPSTVADAAVFIVLLTPGAALVLRRERTALARTAKRRGLLPGTRNTDIRSGSGSSWTLVFARYHDHPDGPGDGVVGALLEDGAYVEGF